MRPEREMAVWAPPAPTRRTFAVLLAEFFGFASVMLMLLAVLLVAGCAPARPLSAAEQRAIEECEYEAAKVGGGFDWIDAAYRRTEVKHRCLRLKGYQP